jgi:hypothetical protein
MEDKRLHPGGPRLAELASLDPAAPHRPTIIFSQFSMRLQMHFLLRLGCPTRQVCIEQTVCVMALVASYNTSQSLAATLYIGHPSGSFGAFMSIPAFSMPAYHRVFCVGHQWCSSMKACPHRMNVQCIHRSIKPDALSMGVLQRHVCDGVLTIFRMQGEAANPANITETNRIWVVLFSMQNMSPGPRLAVKYRTISFNPVHLPACP